MENTFVKLFIFIFVLSNSYHFSYAEEADWLNQDGIVIDDIRAIYQQNETFSDEKKAALIIGDAAATTNFFQGLGANKATDSLLDDSRFLFEKEPPHVVIIGAGPVGLATAIEAKESGARVTLVEKRNSYSRIRWVFLIDSSIKLLEKWNISIPELKITDAGPIGKIGLVPIKNLEEGLLSRVNKLGIEILLGEFKGFNLDHSITFSVSNENIQLPYDILIAADGSHSAVKQALGISNKIYGNAKGAAVLTHTNVNNLAAPAPIQINGLFIRRLALPMETIFSVQGDHLISREELICALNASEWAEEANMGIQNGIVLEHIDVVLQQSETFSDLGKSTIILGDAAATASFFQGLGINIAFLTTQVAADFFENMKRSPEMAYHVFNESMAQITNSLIEDSKYLFEPKKTQENKHTQVN